MNETVVRRAEQFSADFFSMTGNLLKSGCREERHVQLADAVQKRAIPSLSSVFHKVSCKNKKRRRLLVYGLDHPREYRPGIVRVGRDSENKMISCCSGFERHKGRARRTQGNSEKEREIIKSHRLTDQ